MWSFSPSKYLPVWHLPFFLWWCGIIRCPQGKLRWAEWYEHCDMESGDCWRADPLWAVQSLSQLLSAALLGPKWPQTIHKPKGSDCISIKLYWWTLKFQLYVILCITIYYSSFSFSSNMKNRSALLSLQAEWKQTGGQIGPWATVGGPLPLSESSPRGRDGFSNSSDWCATEGERG